MTTNLLSVIEQQHKALEEWERVDVLGRYPHIHRESWRELVRDRNSKHTAALAAGQQALEQTQTQVEAELSHTDALLEECKMDWSGDVTQIKAEHKREVDTLRAQLAALQSQDGLPEPVGCGYVVKWSTGDTPSLYMEGYATVISADVYTADQVRQAQAAVRAKMVPLDHCMGAITEREATAVADATYLQPMDTCPTGVKVQLMNPGGVLAYGTWNGKDTTWQAWAPLPRKEVDKYEALTDSADRAQS